MVASLALVPLFAVAAPASDRVRSLPGWDAALPSAWYSGYVNVTLDHTAMSVHYLYMECEAAAAEAAPTLLWSNGGPGASSLFGLFVELGPLVLDQRSLRTPEYKATRVPTLYRNEFSWSALGSLLVFDWPPPVGFSFCDGEVSLP